MNTPQMLYIPIGVQLSNEDDLARLQWLIAKRMNDLRDWKPSNGWLKDHQVQRVQLRLVRREGRK